MEQFPPRLDVPGLNAVLKTALDAVVVMDLNGVIRGWNDNAQQVFGFDPLGVVGKRMSELIIPQRYRSAHEAGLARFLATGEGPVLDTRLEIEAIRSDGREFPVELSITYSELFGEPLFLGFLRDVSERREAERTRQVLIDELNHRVKNLLGVVSGIAHQTLRTASSAEEFADAFTGRLASLGRSHEILTAAHWEPASLRGMVDTLVGPHQDTTRTRITIDGPDVLLAPKDFLTVSMVIHELLTNALKYGALAQADGELELFWSRDGDGLDLHWNESVPGGIAVPEREGFGTRLIAFSVRHDLKGLEKFGWTAHGLRFHLRFTPR